MNDDFLANGLNTSVLVVYLYTDLFVIMLRLCLLSSIMKKIEKKSAMYKCRFLYQWCAEQFCSDKIWKFSYFCSAIDRSGTRLYFSVGREWWKMTIFFRQGKCVIFPLFAFFIMIIILNYYWDWYFIVPMTDVVN